MILLFRFFISKNKIKDVRGIKPTWEVFFCLAVILLFFTVVYYYPIIYTLFLSFFRWSAIERTYVGLQNYIRLTQDEAFRASLHNTFVYVFATSLGTVIGGLLLALTINHLAKTNPRQSEVYKTIFLLPAVVSFAAVSIVWKWIYDPQMGILNRLLSMVGLPVVGWLTDAKTALLSIIILGIWQNLGFNLILLLGGLNSIPNVYHEAAQIDGANRWDMLTKITIPLMRPIFLFTVVSSVITNFKVFTPIFVMTSGGPVHATSVIVYQIYTQGFRFGQMGYASCISVVFLMIVVLLTIIQMKVGRSEWTF